MQLSLPTILLASKSPRRKQLIQELGFQFKLVHQDIDESFPSQLPKEKVAEFLAQQKAEAVFSQLQDRQIILAADTIVLKDNQIFHKPKDAEDARNILNELSDSMHQVITGVCLFNQSNKHSFSCISKVYFSPISAAEMDYYIDKYQPYDKAGAYAIQEWIGMAKIKRIEGSYHNIVGLPTHEVYNAITNLYK